jgi:uncharacterized protein YcfL
MKTLALIGLILLILSSCKSSKASCDAYSQKEIKKDHQI